ncbi:ring-cleaving dioxygenase [Halomicrobium salinisoli]|uniref:ring-cleaving dioxygenase n=1 Tax=Halomicrobium salinisoli TaxID=2878391 RepID=UPI001CEFEBF3|nr:ring-cleaving dioxygenase [Halomicrobium salinisoli]
MQVNGLHHVTAVAGEPARNLTFYADVLGLRFVKRTVNFDDPTTYHLYYGDETGEPGTVLTFFPFGTTRQGQPGRGQATRTAFVVPEGSLEYWRDRFAEHGVEHDDPTERFDERVLRFEDPDGQPLALVAGESDVAPWGDGPVPEEHAIRGFHGVELTSADVDATAEVLDVLGYERVAEAEDRVRYAVDGDRATVIDLVTGDSRAARPGAGTVHHVAFRAADEDEQDAWRERLQEAGQRVTQRKDRQYFQSVYFREPGGILFEIATDGPGFTRDESVDELGSDLKLPPWLEDDREVIEANLDPLEPPAEAEGGESSADVEAEAEGI